MSPKTEELLNEPFSFDEVPYHVVLNVVEKLSYSDFLNFTQCNTFSDDIILNNKRLRFDEPVESIVFNAASDEVTKLIDGKEVAFKLDETNRARLKPKSIKIKKGILTDESCSRIIDICVQRQITCPGLIITSCMCCEAETFQKLLQVVKCKWLNLPRQAGEEYLQIRELQQVQTLCILNGRPVSDSLFLKLKSPELRLYGSHVTTKGLISYFKEWISGVRETKYLLLGSVNEIQKDEVQLALKDHSVDSGNPSQFKIQREDGKVLEILLTSHIMAFPSK